MNHREHLAAFNAKRAPIENDPDEDELETTIAGPRQFVPSGPYVPQQMEPSRKGADDHKRYRSRGV